MKNISESVTFTNISGINFPSKNREFLIGLFRDVAQKHNSKFIIIAGNTLDGRYLDDELKHRIKEQKKVIDDLNKDVSRGQKAKFTNQDKIKLEEEFIDETADKLNEFLPVLGINYHVVISEVYDRSIGISILKKLQNLRNDIRLHEDPEEKIPIGEESARVIVPTKKPWHYKFVTGLMQRLIDAFIQRTFSPKPLLILVGCTGTSAIIPYYKNIPCFSIPALCKIDKIEKGKPTENTVGCLVIKVSTRNGKSKITARTYDFRTAVFQEGGIATAEKVSGQEKEVIDVLKKGSVSLNTLIFRVNRIGGQQKQEIFTPGKIDKIVSDLCERKIIVFNKESNKYSINKDLVKQANASLADFLKDNRVIRHAIISCIHIGALKTLYFTILKHLTQFIFDCDALIINGDLIQGMAHDYEYNGEVLPITIGVDKQEILAAHIISKVLSDNFDNRFSKLENTKIAVEEIIDKCLLDVVINTGNHDMWATKIKHSLPLGLFRDRLILLLFTRIVEFCKKISLQGNALKIPDIISILNNKIKFVGESKLVGINGITIGLKHPHQSRTITKSQRSQESISSFLDRKEPLPNNFFLVYVANFHEAAAAHWKVFDKTYLGVMTGAYLKDTQFENNKNKVVDFGPAKITVSFNQENQIIYTEIEFNSHICELDKKIVDKDKIETTDVLDLGQRLSKIVNLPWR